MFVCCAELAHRWHREGLGVGLYPHKLSRIKLSWITLVVAVDGWNALCTAEGVLSPPSCTAVHNGLQIVHACLTISDCEACRSASTTPSIIWSAAFA